MAQSQRFLAHFLSPKLIKTIRQPKLVEKDKCYEQGIGVMVAYDLRLNICAKKSQLPKTLFLIVKRQIAKNEIW